MKKVLWFIVCLMAMVVSFTSCSSDDENENSTENYTYFNGEWYDAENCITHIIHDGWIDVMDATGSVIVSRVQFEIKNNIIILREKYYYYGKIYKINPTEFEFDINGKSFKLKRKIS